MTRDDDIYKRAREFMCRCHGNCVGCPIQTAARKERLTCTEHQQKHTEKDRSIVMGWRNANYKLSTSSDMAMMQKLKK